MLGAASIAIGLAVAGQLVSPVAADRKPIPAADVRGLHPSLLEKYDTSSAAQFTCLDGSKSVPWTAINDDYCDCPDGSDEPGTSACEGRSTARFYCKNEGFEEGWVLASRVNDGICDPECCDGSDEWQTGACPNRCAEIGAEIRKARELELKTRKTGAKIRGTYVKWAQTEKKRLEAELQSKQAEISAKEQDVERTRIALEKSESRSKEELERRKQSPLYTSLLSHRLALTRLRSRLATLQAESDTMHSILEELSKSYNPNYQDMAVKAAVVGYTELLDAAHGAVSEGGDAAATDAPVKEVEEEITDRELDELERKDLEAVVLADLAELEGEDDDDESGDGILYRIDEYIPDMLYDSWEAVRDLALDWMIKLGIIGRSTKAAAKNAVDGPHVAAARQKHTDAQNNLHRLNNEVRMTKETLEKLQGAYYGKDAEWKKLDGTCIDKEVGGYTYELCFFGRATQKDGNGYAHHLGTFVEWDTSKPEGSFEYYSQQKYLNGMKCWNGPNRSVMLELSCGTQNALLSVSEPEKCEYHFKATTPALCWPVEESAETAAAASAAATAAQSVKQEL